MKYLCTLKNNRTTYYESIITFAPLPLGTVIGWGPDDKSPDGIAYWTVIRCEEVK